MAIKEFVPKQRIRKVIISKAYSVMINHDISAVEIRNTDLKIKLYEEVSQAPPISINTIHKIKKGLLVRDSQKNRFLMLINRILTEKKVDKQYKLEELF